MVFDLNELTDSGDKAFGKILHHNKTTVNMKREVKTKVLLDNSNLIKRSEISYQQIHEGFFIQNWE